MTASSSSCSGENRIEIDSTDVCNRIRTLHGQSVVAEDAPATDGQHRLARKCVCCLNTAVRRTVHVHSSSSTWEWAVKLQRITR